MSSAIDVKDYDKKDLLSIARIAEAAERYPDMCKFMHQLITMKCAANEALTIDERNLLSVAYKNVVGSKRQSWRTLSAGNFQDLDVNVVQKYKELVENELETVCQEVLDLLKDGPVKKAQSSSEDASMSDEDGVFYLKMCGDYYRYLAEFKENEEKYKTDAEKYYTDAMNLAEGKLPETHPTRLGLALNFSVCYYEILKKKKEACDLAKKAFDAAIEKLDTLNDASYKDSTLIMQLLRDNLTLWTSEGQEENGDENA